MLSERLKYLYENDWLSLWPTISVVLFLAIFIFIVFMVLRYKKKDVQEWESMPLDEDGSTNYS
jgi:hypothetical protein